MQYILEESEIKGLLLCKKYIQELYDSLSQNIENNPELKNNKGIMEGSALILAILIGLHNIPEGMDFEDWLDGLEPTEDGKLAFKAKS